METVVEEGNLNKKKKRGVGVKIRIGNPSFRRLISGAFAGAVSRTAVAPLETIRTHLMVGSSGNSTTEVFENIMKTDGWKGLFGGNLVNVIRVAPSKAIELFAFDTVKKVLTPKNGEPPKLPIPPSLIAGACAGVSSTLCTYLLELLKTRLTIEREIYNNLNARLPQNTTRRRPCRALPRSHAKSNRSRILCRHQLFRLRHIEKGI